MMQLPTFPTDSLYKFLFIAGLAIIFFSSYLYVNQKNTLQEKVDLVEFEKQKISAELEILIDNNSEYLHDQDNLMKSLRDITKNTPQKAVDYYLRQNDSLAEIGKRYRETSNQIKYNTSLINSSEKKLDDGFKNLYKILKTYIIISTIGIIITLISGSFWYCKIQKPVDKKIQLEIDILKKQIAKGQSFDTE